MASDRSQSEHDFAQPIAGQVSVGGKAASGKLGALSWPVVALVLACAAGIYLALLWESTDGSWRRRDYSQWYTCGLALRIARSTGSNPYSTDLSPLARRFGMETVAQDRVNYPPSGVLLFELLSERPPESGYHFWRVGEFVVLAGIVCLMILEEPAFNVWTKVSLSCLAILFYPVSEGIFLSEVTPLLLLLLLVMLRAVQRGHHRVAGAALAIACLLKVFPGIFFVYLALWKRWRSIGWSIAFVTVGMVVTMMQVGVENSLSFVTRLQFLNSMRGPLSVTAAVFHFFKYVLGAPSDGFGAAARTVVIGVMEIAVLAVAIKATLNARTSSDGLADTFALWLVTMVLLCPTAWGHYGVFLLPTLVQLAAAAVRGRAIPAALWCGIAAYVVTESAKLANAVMTSRVLSFGRLAVVPIDGKEYGLLLFPGLLCLAAAYWLCSARLITLSDLAPQYSFNSEVQ